jgi:methylated-DNA-[protein]-cysteine S-methyltransferase
MLTFTQKVLSVVRKIPKGKTMTYGDVAKRAGSSGAARVVGSIMKNNFLLDVPCHRVIPAGSGKTLTIKNVGEYNRGGPKAKLKLIISEKI